jgi:hypothetical protein
MFYQFYMYLLYLYLWNLTALRCHAWNKNNALFLSCICLSHLLVPENWLFWKLEVTAVTWIKTDEKETWTHVSIRGKHCTTFTP